ncbi:MAG TPA: methyltransferase domain-containing protein [Bryobacteraceae bacterium]|jgi:trans-aconitate methyltransferase|nr:methyltransferase domain-containing protein [Bryobacteraceae bacterium]
MKQNWDAARYQSRHSYVFAHGESLIDLLEPLAGERILDLGCGSGQLTAKIAESGAEVIGLDRSEEMIAEARRNYPSLKFEVADAADFRVERPVDAVFSNAALHWVKNADGVAQSVASALRRPGRFVLEMGGKGNVQSIIDVLHEVAGVVETPWYFPSVGEYTSLLERHGFEISFAALFDRPTRVEGEDGLEDWLRMFAGSMAGSQEVQREIANRLRPKMFREGAWIIDYRRLQVVARCVR